MAPPAPFNVSHRYDTENPDAIIPLVSTSNAERSLSIFKALGARHKFRVLRKRQLNGEPEYPHGDALYLDVDRDPVVPMYSIMQFQPDSWDIQVCYDEGGEPEIYPCKTKDAALEFQGLLTGYNTAASFEDVHVSVLHVPDMPGPSILKKLARLTDHEAIGEVQLWQRREPSTGAGSAAGPRSVASDPRRGSTARTDTSAGDAVSLQTDPVTNQGVYISDSPQPPALAAFTRSRSGEVMMLKVDLCDMQVHLHGGLIEISRPKRAIFTALRISAKEGELARWNICRFSTLATRRKDGVPNGDVRNEDSLECSYITLKPSRSGEAERLRHKILELRIEYLRVEAARVEALRAAQGNRTPPIAGPSGARASSVSSGSRSFVGLPPLPAMSALDVTLSRNDTIPRPELDTNPQRAELDGSTPLYGGTRPQQPPSASGFRARLRRPLRKGRRRRGSQNSQNSQRSEA